ncbi:MAG: hypothetical protein AB8E15_03045 [Bdellovibrionales bacterium]
MARFLLIIGCLGLLVISYAEASPEEAKISCLSELDYKYKGVPARVRLTANVHKESNKIYRLELLMGSVEISNNEKIHTNDLWFFGLIAENEVFNQHNYQPKKYLDYLKFPAKVHSRFVEQAYVLLPKIEKMGETFNGFIQLNNLRNKYGPTVLLNCSTDLLY